VTGATADRPDRRPGADGPSGDPNPRGSGAPAIPPPARQALRLALALIAVYIVLDIVAQLLPPHYSPLSQAESDLAVGPYGYVMTVNFVVRGVLSLALLFGIVSATSIGRRSPVGIALVAVWGLGAFVLAASPTDVTGPMTLHGAVHLATAAIAFLAGAVGELLLSLRFRDEPRLAGVATPALAVSGLSVVALLALLVVQARPVLFAAAFGLAERVFLGLVLLWMLLVAVHLLRTEGGASAGRANGA
jgi:hypothetical protein